MLKKIVAGVVTAGAALALTAAPAQAAGVYVQSASIVQDAAGYQIVVVVPTNAWRYGGYAVNSAAYAELASIVPGITNRTNLRQQAQCHFDFATDKATWNLEADRRTTNDWGWTLFLSGCNPSRVGKITYQQLVSGVELPGAY